jgi:hypothetical protein
MGVRTSPLLATTSIQYLEQNQIIHILCKHNIIGYFRYVDDILIIYNNHTKQIENTLI